MTSEYPEAGFTRIKKLLIDLYGDDGGRTRFDLLKEKADAFLNSRSEKQIRDSLSFDPAKPYEALKGKIFVIAYPDNVYTDNKYPLMTLKRTLKDWFPSIRGMHILPERTMSHNDIWPQDIYRFCDHLKANLIVRKLQEDGILDDNRIISDDYESLIGKFMSESLPELAGDDMEILKKELPVILDAAWNSHFNDGGFSQKTRAVVDPRFGENRHLEDLTGSFSTMLDFVVNHLDMDNDYLEEFRRGNNDGEAFVIIYRDEYRQLKADGVLNKTFRPRPFPLFTGMRKYPVTDLDGKCLTPDECAVEMNRIFTANDLEPLDERLIRFMSIYFKIENDQGLTSEDKRIFNAFEQYAAEKKIDTSAFWEDSQIQARQKVINYKRLPDMEALMEEFGLSIKYADIFMNDSDHVFGREFYIYTTFSESQADVNPLTLDGFNMIVEDLFHLLSSGSLTMMRMDAIKYLWKEIGKKNFDMEEGNKLIEVIRTLMKIVSPSTLPLDEINSPDPVVYSMARDGGFAYLFGQVNAVPIAFNEGSLEPLIRFNKTRNEQCPENLLPFVMLSTHDGRSVQGLGVQRSDGHVSIGQFYNLKDTVESRGGKPKFRSVAKGEISGDTFRKVFTEAGYEKKLDRLSGLFDRNLIGQEDLYRLRDNDWEESDLLEEMASILDEDVRDLAGSPAVDYFIQWIIYGRTAYELCCTTRSSFSLTDSSGNTLTEDEEARRMVLAQLFVLTQGQDVPAIYFNDLIGLENDFKSFELSGRPRDLNRHKNRLDEMVDLIKNDPFTGAYVEKLNEILKLRAEDRSFAPGEGSFRFSVLSDTVFLHHPWHSGEHSFIVGNIVNREETVTLSVEELGDRVSQSLTDQISGRIYKAEEGRFQLSLEPYGYLWLK
ncbi:hypothetical protein [Spirochaeta isovalerica]|uniref:Uncharacterized protein n=1 Tax=Spirochaeta isovalerica TaxID=150 RepID=A0A841R6F4_9SPIO|nr:hypothetical protein [Spirochaeta isovalerica]MBB6478579.1 hypothetical protein [Spirochaeta isovalerica]